MAKLKKVTNAMWDAEHIKVEGYDLQSEAIGAFDFEEACLMKLLDLCKDLDTLPPAIASSCVG
jgi:hypothetical protein